MSTRVVGFIEDVSELMYCQMNVFS